MQYPALGIDISQLTVAVTLMTSETMWHHGNFTNDAKGFSQLRRWVQRHVNQAVWVCLEATGRYSDAIAHYLFAESWVAQVSVLNPSRIHAYGQSQMRRSKTDKADAYLLAHFAATQSSDAFIPPSPQQQALQELMRHRDNLLDMRQQVRNRLKAGVRHDEVQRQLHEQEQLLTRQIAEVEQTVQQQIKQDADLWRQYKLLCSIAGVGPILAAHFLAEVPDITRFESASQLAAYAGLVPTQHDSGTSVHKKGKLAKTGNVHLRTAFYMPALCAARHNPLIAAFVARLQAKGKAKMTIVAAVMHKLLRLAYGVLKSGRPFDPDFAVNVQFAS
jgi:transposase